MFLTSYNSNHSILHPQSLKNITGALETTDAVTSAGGAKSLFQKFSKRPKLFANQADCDQTGKLLAVKIQIVMMLKLCNVFK